MVTLCGWQWGRCTRPEPAVLLVDHGTDSAERLALCLHGHHVTRDVEADVSGGAMLGKGEAPFWEPCGDVALAIVAVPDVGAATKARDVLQYLPMLDGIAVGGLNFRAGLPDKRG